MGPWRHTQSLRRHPGHCILAVLRAGFVGAIAFRASSPQFSLEASQIFLFIFVPQYLIFAGLFRSRALSSFHRRGKSTV
jgi:hypothetical protein